LKISDKSECFFVIIGSGTECYKLSNYINAQKPEHVMLISQLPKDDYDSMVGSCDVGMIFLDHRFTIPNFPSRLLSYMQAKIPVLAVTDTSTDIGEIIQQGSFGWWCESDNADLFSNLVKEISFQHEDFGKLGENAMEYLINNYSVKNEYKNIMSSINRLNSQEKE